MELNITGIFIKKNKNGYVIIKHDEDDKNIHNFKWTKHVTASIAPEFIGIKTGKPCIIDNFVEGDEVKAHLKLVKYLIVETGQEGYRLILLKMMTT